MSRTYYHSRTEANAAEYDKQVKREAFWNPILEALATVGAAFMFFVYCMLWVGLVVMVGCMLYFVVGGPLSMFGVYVPGISDR